jgi:hypothetical protein
MVWAQFFPVFRASWRLSRAKMAGFFLRSEACSPASSATRKLHGCRLGKGKLEGVTNCGLSAVTSRVGARQKRAGTLEWNERHPPNRPSGAKQAPEKPRMDGEDSEESPARAKARTLFCCICGPAKAVPLLQSSPRMSFSAAFKARVDFATFARSPLRWIVRQKRNCVPLVQKGDRPYGTGGLLGIRLPHAEARG